MDNRSGEDPPIGRRIALGLSDYIKGFAARRGAQTWDQFAKVEPLRWQYYLLELADDPTTTILFNLHGVDISAGLTRASTGRGTPTDWEILRIDEHDSWWPRIERWDQDVPALDPFDRGEEG